MLNLVQPSSTFDPSSHVTNHHLPPPPNNLKPPSNPMTNAKPLSPPSPINPLPLNFPSLSPSLFPPKWESAAVSRGSTTWVCPIPLVRLILPPYGVD